MTPEQIEYLAGLAHPCPEWGGTGASLLAPSSNDWPARAHPEIGAVLTAGLPDVVDLRGQVQGIGNQGQQNSCVAFSTCEIIDVDSYEGSRTWPVLLPSQLYAECGGTTGGIDSRACLERCRVTGAPAADGTRMKIGSYLWVTQAPGNFREEVKASIAVGKPVCIALLLPQQFGWSSSGAPTTGYHQMAAVGYDATWCIFANSWGRGFGENGFCRVTWDYLEANNMQQRFVFGYLVTPAAPVPMPIPTPTPLPTPLPAPTPFPGPEFQTALLSRVNQERAAVGVAALVEDDRLEICAQGHSNSMAAGNYFSHDGPDGTAQARVNGAIPNMPAWGENIAAGWNDPNVVVNAWMASPGHKANILNSHFTLMGGGLGTNPNSTYRYYVTQDFGAGGNPTPGPLPVPTPAPTPITTTKVTVTGTGLTTTEGNGWVVVQGQGLVTTRS